MSAETQARADFLAERLTGVGGSDAASLLNIGWGCRRRLWYEKKNVEPDYKREETGAMALGTFLEPFFVRKYSKDTGREVAIRQELIRHPSLSYLTVHLDAVVYRSGTVPDDHFSTGVSVTDSGVLEVKSCGRGAFYKYKRAGLPEDYILQVQHALLVTGLSWGSYCIGCRDNGEILRWDVDRSKEIQDEIVNEARHFWHGDMPTGGGPLRLSPDDGRCQTCAYRTTCQGELLPVEKAGEYERDESLAELVIERTERAKLRKEAEVLFDDANEELKAALGDRSMVTAAGYKIQYYTIHKKAYTVAEHAERPLRLYAPKVKK